MAHARVHAVEKPFHCSDCDKDFSNDNNFYNHMRACKGNKLYICAICDMSFLHGGHSLIHKRSHTGEKPFKCNICDKTFSAKSNLILKGFNKIYLSYLI